MIKIKTPKGTTGYLNLVVPDTRFNPEGVYKANIVLTEEQAEKLLKTLRAEATNELGPKKAAKAKMPGKPNEDGTVTFTFKSKSKPSVYDSGANLLAPEAVEALYIGGGTIIRVNGEAKAYENGLHVGVTLYLREVQIVHLVKCKESGFEPDAEGSFVVRSGERGG